MKNIITLWVVVVLLVISYVAIPVHAQESCGSIIAPENWGDLESPLTTISIINCSDPFQKSSGASPYTLIVNNAVVGEGNELLLLDGKVTGYEVSGWVPMRSAYSLLFFHDGADYRFINMDPSVPSEADYRTFAGEYFPSGTDIEPYISAALDPELRFSMDYDMRDILYAYLDYVDQHFVSQFPTLTAGTYTLVTHEYELMVTKADFLQKLFAYIIPTAYAQSVPVPTTYTLTFTVKTEEAPTGASSVLFLPGIQASRLYKKGLLFEDMVWEPNGNGDIWNLSMDDRGVSEEDLYTRDILREIYGVINVYEGFSRYMDGLISDAVIEDWEPFAYDWRYDVFDIVEHGTQYEGEVRYPTLELEKLAEDSFSGKVTIIAHSNGGLFAKALLVKLEKEGKAHLVDKVILLASPQLGTPKAIGTILHGFDQKLLGGLVAEDTVVRSVIKNLPGVYGLVPSSAYFNSSQVDMVQFDNSVSTSLFRNLYGDAITSDDELIGFMNGSEGRPIATTIHDASTAHGILLSNAEKEHREKLDTWIAPEGIEVIEVVGVGINTVAGFTYTEFSEKVCTEPSGLEERECHTEIFYKPVPYFTQYGDETVVGTSAEGYGGEKKTYYFDLDELEKDEQFTSVEHSNITETEPLHKFITAIIKNETRDQVYLSEEKPLYVSNSILFGTHSPVRLSISDNVGNRVGVFDEGGTYPSIREDISGSTYLELAGSTYVIVPQEGKYTAHIEGTGWGGMTLTLDTLNGEEKRSLVHITLATITPSTTAMVTYSDGVYSNVVVDEDGDGATDYYVNENSEVIPVVMDYGDLVDAIKVLKTKKALKTVLLAQAQMAERQSIKHPKIALQMLRMIEIEIHIGMKKKILSLQDGETLLNIIRLIK